MKKQAVKKHRLPVYIKPERYKLLLRPDFDHFTFYGEETIFLELEKTTRQITLHSAELEIDSVEWVIHGVENWVGKIAYDPKTETATFTFPKNLAKGKGELKLKFKGILSDKMRGFYRSKFEHNGEIKHLATTQFESTDARRAFPCFDEPAKKAIFDVTLMIPPQMRAISNTIESQILEHESGLKVVEFESTPKMSTYILAFLVGEFEYIQARTKDGVLVRVFTTPGKKIQAKFALEVGIKCLEFYNSYFGIAYPLPVLDMIAIPDFAAGAMENWGAVTYRESTLLIDRESSSTANKQWVALVIAHELAHMWFGNLVTMEWWTHLWLNEGFASFIEYLAIDHIFPEWEIWNQFVSQETGTAFALDALKNTHPIEVKVGHPAEISEIFDKVSYSKGASILRMLHEYLGALDFQKGLQHYLKTHSYGNAQTEDLWKSLEEVSKKKVRKIMANWTAKAGHPVVTVREKGKGLPAGRQGARGKLELTQSRFFLSPISKKQTKDRTVWSIPLSSLRMQGSNKQKSGSELDSRTFDITQFLMDKKTISINMPKDGEWIKLNSGETSLVRVDYPHEYLKKLTPAIINKQLPASDRLGLIRDVFSLAQLGQTPTSLALELVESYKNEDDYIVWAEIVEHLTKLDSLLAFEDFYGNFKVFARQIYQPISQKLGWASKKGEKHTQTLLRSIILFNLGYFEDEDTMLYASQLFKKFLEDGAKINPDLKSLIYNLIAKNGGIDQYYTLLEMYKKDTNQQERERIGRSLGLFKSKEILQKTLNFAISDSVRYQNTLGIIASVWGNPQGRYLAWEFVKKHFKLLKERYAGGHYFTRVFTPAGQFTTKQDAKDIQQFIKKNPTPEAQRTIAQVLEQIYSNEAWLKRDKKGIKKFLERFESKIC